MHFKTIVAGIAAGTADESGPQQDSNGTHISWLRTCKESAEDHGYAADYQRIGRGLVDYYLQVRRSLVLVKTEPITLPLPGCEISIRPDAVADGPGGKVILRRVKSGKKPSGDLDELEFGILQLAAAHAYGAQAKVEISFLTSEESVSLELTERKLKSRRRKAEDIVTKIREGEYPAQEGARTCPRCPSYFVCGPVPHGPLQAKI